MRRISSPACGFRDELIPVPRHFDDGTGGHLPGIDELEGPARGVILYPSFCMVRRGQALDVSGFAGAAFVQAVFKSQTALFGENVSRMEGVTLVHLIPANEDQFHARRDWEIRSLPFELSAELLA